MIDVPVLYLDIDGTVREGKDDALGRFVNGPEDVRVFPQAVERMREWRERGGRIVGLSNQGGVALGHMTAETCMSAMQETAHQAEELFDGILACYHHPDAPDPILRRCPCRKPRAGMIMDAISDLCRRNPGEVYPVTLALMVGDRREDRLCAQAANVDFRWARHWRRGSTGHLSPEENSGRYIYPEEP